MKARYFTKQQRADGMTLYAMGRIVMGSQVEVRLAATAREMAHHRSEVAYVLRCCRRELAREAEKVWQDIADAHMAKHYGNENGGAEQP